METLKLTIYLMLAVLYKGAQSATLNDTNTLLADLLEDYNTNVRPVLNQSLPVYITVQPYIKSIQEFDEVKEMFSYVGAIAVLWIDEKMQWDPSAYGGLNEITVSYGEVWVPEMILSSPSDNIDSMGKKWNRIRFYSTGYAVWLPVDLIKSTCSVNVKNYPFDSQTCVTSFNALGYARFELTMLPLTDKIDMTIYQPNSLWDIRNTSVKVTDSQLDCTFYLQRKPSFVIINILLPILFLSLLNVLVFLLVPESGERASYCITVLLSIAVFMTIVSDMLPRSSQPVPIISFKLMVDIVISSLIVVVAILNLRIFNRDDNDPVPKWLQSFYLYMTCFRRKKAAIQSIDHHLKTFIPTADDKKSKLDKRKSMKTINVRTFAVLTNEDIKKKHSMADFTEEVIERQKITWKKISYMLDWVAFVIFSVSSITSFCIFFAMTAN